MHFTKNTLENPPRRGMTRIGTAVTDLVRSISDLGEDFACRCYEAERQLIAGGWVDPIGLHNAACRHGLFGDRFADSRLGWTHNYVVFCGETRRTPSVDECCRVAAPRVFIDGDWLYGVIFTENIRGADLDRDASEVADLADIRERTGKHHLIQYARSLVDADRFEIVVRQKQAKRRTYVPVRYRTRRGSNTIA